MKEKRKARLDKSDTGFIGFGAFVDTTVAGLDVSASVANSSSNALQWTPVYEGIEARTLFARLTKKDPTTVRKALVDVQGLLSNDQLDKRSVRIPALQHFAYLYARKLHYASSGTVRSQSMQVWQTAHQTLPKATQYLAESHPILQGQWQAVRVDSEVRQACMESYVTVDGVLQYVHQMLAYGRPRNMHQDLFATPQNANSLTEQQQDELQEKYERIISTALHALRDYLERHGDSVQVDDASLWWKSLSSNFVSIRRQGYALVVVVPAANLPASTALAHAVAHEKQAVNLPVLLEAIVAYLVAKQKDDNNGTTPLIRPLTKLLQKGVYGAPVRGWGPVLLPLVSLLESNPNTIQTLLLAVWQGREWTLGAADRWQLMTYLAESLTWLLLRPQDDADFVQSLAKFWKKILHETLRTSIAPLRGAVRTSLDELLHQLANNVAALRGGTQTCAYAKMGETIFWENCASIILDADPSTLTAWVTMLRVPPTDFLEDALRHYFVQELQKYQVSSGNVPDLTAYALFQHLLTYCKAILVDQERFVTNDLLRWIIVHTSSISALPQTKELVTHDFALLALVLGVDGRDLWQTVLSEVVKAKVDLEWLADGLHVLMQSNRTWIQCGVLDSFALEVSRRDVRHPSPPDDGSNDAPYNEYRKVLRFLTTCVGLHDKGSTCLVSDGIVSEWTQESSSDSTLSFADDDGLHASPRLEVLMQLVKKQSPLIPSDCISGIVFEAWVRGGALFVGYASGMIEADPLLREAFINKATRELSSQLHRAPNDDEDHEALVSFCETWADRASSVFDIVSKEPATKEAFWPAVGLSEDWRTLTEVKYLCATLLAQSIRHEGRLGLDLLCMESDGRYEVLVNTMLVLAEASGDFLEASRTRGKQDRAAGLCRLLGLSSAKKDALVALVNIVLDSMETIDPKNAFAARKHVSVLSLLVSMVFPLSEDPTLYAKDSKAGDRVWYVADTKNPSAVVSATITKVHYDDIAGYYFSIQVDGSENVPERQTVAERLKREKPCVDDARGRKEIAQRILNIVRGDIGRTSWASSVPELLCVVLSLNTSERGIGSIHYDTIQMIKQQVTLVQSSLDDPEEVWKLVLTLGFGLNVSTARHVVRSVPFGAASLLSSVQTLSEEKKHLDVSVIALVSICVTSMGPSDGSVFLEGFDLVCKQASHLLQADVHVTTPIYCGLKALRDSLLSLDHTIRNEELQSLSGVMSVVLERYFVTWEEDSSSQPVSSLVEEILGMCCKLPATHFLVAEGALSSSPVQEGLLRALHEPQKRLTSLLILNLLINSKKNDSEATIELFLSSLSEGTSLDREALDDDVQVGRFLTWLLLLELACDEANRVLISYETASAAMSSAMEVSAESLSFLLRRHGAETGSCLVDLKHLSADVSSADLGLSVLFQTIESLPSLSRRWWEEACPKPFSAPMKDFVQKYVSPAMMRREIERIKKATTFGEMKVCASPVSREVVATYVQDDFTLKVSIAIPATFPFRSAEVDCSKTLGVPQNRWRRWNMMISQMLNNQDSTLLEALMLWKENVDKEYDGVEPCVICYSCISVKTHKLPTLECKNCNNRFHHDCLMQWFAQSGKNQCVLCQLPWQGTRV